MFSMSSCVRLMDIFPDVPENSTVPVSGLSFACSEKLLVNEFVNNVCSIFKYINFIINFLSLVAIDTADLESPPTLSLYSLGGFDSTHCDCTSLGHLLSEELRCFV